MLSAHYLALLPSIWLNYSMNRLLLVAPVALLLRVLLNCLLRRASRELKYLRRYWSNHDRAKF